MTSPWKSPLRLWLKPRRICRKAASKRNSHLSGSIGLEPLETRLALSITPFAIADRFEANDTFSNATDLETVFGRREESDLSIHTGSDEDWFKFVLPAVGTKADYVEVVFRHADGDLDALLYNANRDLVASSRGNVDNEVLRLDGQPVGTYYVRVLGSSQAVNDDYSLVIKTHLRQPDRLEPNDALPGRAIGPVLGRTTFRDLAISSYDDVDFYRFLLPYGGMEDSSITIVFSHATGDLDARLRDANGQVLDHADSVTDNERLSLAGLPPGEYVLEVFGFDATNSYDLEFVAPQPPPSEFCIAINVDTLVSNSDRPTLTGTIECLDATIFVQVGELEPRPVPNPRTGGWILPGSDLPAALPEGDHQVVAWTTNALGDYAEDRGVLTIDLTAPTARFAPVASPRSTGLSSLMLAFTETVVGFDLNDLMLTRDDEPVSLDGVSLLGADSDYQIHGLGSLTDVPGSYALRLKATDSGVQDRAGNLLVDAVSIQWEVRSSVPVGPGWAFLLEPAIVSELAVDPVGTVYVAGHFSGRVNFNPTSPSPFWLSTDGDQAHGFVASYDASGALVQVTQTDFAVSQLSVTRDLVAVGGGVRESGVTSGFVQVFEVGADGSLTETHSIQLPAERVIGPLPGGFGGVSITELVLASDGQMFLGGVLYSATMNLIGQGGGVIRLTVPVDQGDGFVAAFTPLGACAWAKPLLASDWNASPVFPNSLAYEPGSGTLAFGVALSSSIGLLPDSLPFDAGTATAIGLHASTGAYRWAAPVIVGGLDAMDTVALVATPDGSIHAAAHAFVQVPSAGEVSALGGRVAAALITIDAGSGQYLAGPDLDGLLGGIKNVYVSDFTRQPDGASLLAVTRVDSSGDAGAGELSLLLMAPRRGQEIDPPQLWSAPMKGFTSQVQVAGDNRVVMRTAVVEKTVFPIPSDPLTEVVPIAPTQAIWSLANPFSPPELVVDVPVGESALQGAPYEGDGTVVKRGDGTLILDHANSHLGGLIVESGTVVIRHREALNRGRLEVWDGAEVIFDSTSPHLGDAIVAVKELRLLPAAAIDLQRAGMEIAVGGVDGGTLRQLIIGGRTSRKSGIFSSTAAESGGTRTIGYLQTADGRVLVAFAAPGDTNLDRQVNVFDLVSVNSAGRFGSGRQATWQQGDVDYDGTTSVFDLVAINTGGAYGNGPYSGAGLSSGAVSSQRLDMKPLPASEAALAFAWLAEEQKASNARKPLRSRS